MKNVINNITEQVRHQYEQYPYPDIEPKTENPNMLVSCHLSLMCDLIWAGKKSPEGLRVLDAGCGTGSPLTAMALAYKDTEIVGVDFSESSLQKARQLAERNNLKNVRFYNIELENVKKLGQQFDFIISSGVLHHLSDPAKGLNALGEVLDPQGAISIMLYGRYGRIGINMLQEVIKLSCADEDSMPNRIAFARNLAMAIPAGHPFKTRRQGREISEGKDAGIVDLLLHAQDIPFDVNTIFKLCSQAKLEFYQWLFPLIYNPETYIKNPLITGHLKNHLPEDLYRIAELMHGRISKHSFFAVKPTFSAPKTKIENGGWRELKAYLTPCLKWNQVCNVPGEEDVFSIPPAVVQDEWDPLRTSQWELHFLSLIQPQITLGEIVERPEVKKMLPFKSRGEVNTGVEMLLKKVLGMLGIVLLES
jgi:SAM-dependent methyltransferase